MKRPIHHSGRAYSQGLALVELMIAMALGLVLIGAATGIMMSNTQTFKASKITSQVQDSARLAFELMARDIRQAGSIPCGNGIAVRSLLTESNNTLPWYFDWEGKPKYSLGQNQAPNKPPKGQLVGHAGAFSLPGLDNRVPNTETLTVLYASTPGASLQKFDAAGSNYTLNSNKNNFIDNDFVFICDTQYASIFRAKVSEDSNTEITAAELNNTSTLPGAFNKNASVGKLKSRAWYIGTNDQGRSSLYLAELTSTGLQRIKIAPGVKNLTLEYRVKSTAENSEDFQTTTDIENANLWQQVNTVKITLELVDDSQNKDIDGFKEEFTSIVALRNRNS